jgi:maltose O-acetyltransferase
MEIPIMADIKNILKYLWLRTVLFMTSWMSDCTPALRLRGFLMKSVFKKCGRNFQIATGVKINNPYNISLGNDVFFGNYCWINATDEILISDEVMLGPFVVVTSGDHAFKNGSARFAEGLKGKVKIGRGVWIGAHVVVTRGVTVGDGALIGAGAVVTKDVKAGTVNAGVPSHQIADHVKEV